MILMSGVPFSSMILSRYFALVIVFISSPVFKSQRFFISWNCFDVLIILSANSICKRSLSKAQNILFFESGDYVKATRRLPQASSLSCLTAFCSAQFWRGCQKSNLGENLILYSHLVFKKSGGYFYFKEVVDMPFIAPELIIQAKQMDLLTYLKNYEPYLSGKSVSILTMI